MFKSLRTLAFATLLPFTLPILAQVNATLLANVQKALQTSKLTGDDLSLVLIPLDGPGNPTYYSANVSMDPASTIKLFTIYVALEMLSPTYQWKTGFYADGRLKNGVLNDNLYLKGGGDPKPDMEELWLLIHDLRANGVTKITGGLVLDRSYFNVSQLPVFNDGGGSDTEPFLIGPDSLLVNLRNVRIMIRTDGNKVNMQMDPPLTNVRVDSQMKTTASVTCPIWPKLHFSPVTQFDGTTLLATGQIPQGRNAQTYISLLDHPGYTAGAVRSIWQKLGGGIPGKDHQGDVPRNTTLIARAFSPGLVKIIRDINKYSNSTMARQLFLSIGAQFHNSADGSDAQTAQRVMRRWLVRKGITAPRLVMENGSRPSHQGRVSAREMAAMLQAVWHNPHAAKYVSLLPLTDLDDTMRKRLRRTTLIGEARVKVDTLNTMRALTGFNRDASDHNWVAVAILNNSRPWGASAILDQVLLNLHARK